MPSTFRVIVHDGHCQPIGSAIASHCNVGRSSFSHQPTNSKTFQKKQANIQCNQLGNDVSSSSDGSTNVNIYRDRKRANTNDPTLVHSGSVRVCSDSRWPTFALTRAGL